jgi:hypothetical protein
MKKKSGKKKKKRVVNEIVIDCAGLQAGKIKMTNNTRCRLVVNF